MTTELQPSKLGTKEHWDKVYSEELTNFEEIGDEGEIWFGEESIEKMVDWCLMHVPSLSNPAVLEVGSGNGALLFALAEAGYSQKLLIGIDYSDDAVKLSTKISATRNATEIMFSVCDFLREDPSLPSSLEHSNVPSCWDLVLDKGTYDAIALGSKDSSGRSPAGAYPHRLCRLLKPGGLFLITSCNFTEEELKSSFITEETGLQYHSRIQHPTFSFGGRSGSIVSSVAFKKPM
ncbi:hypothetical protein Agabi119p4_5408 [Agaricus bisporus var. burnettii]|uniref:Protein-lysine N-methyltransferase EFM4 n=1 Tax=Agaricus bisporus var. burnettii TaxID=192524 RepID=A0A8H7F1M6_AGABI|nr:hypothetical protein Agabi119p4_5408 [Agaricus bisporus var. burnettii]